MTRWLVIVFLLTTSPRVFADDATAKALFDQGKTLFAEGKYGEACPKLEASFKLNALSGTRGLLGACYEKIGRLASAWAAFRDAATLAARQGNAERAQASREKAAELEPKLAHLTIDASAVAKVSGIEILIDGTVQPAGALGSSIPVDAGQHLILARAADHKSWQTTIDIEDGEKQRTTVPKLVEDHSARLAEEARVGAVRSTIRRRKLLAYGLGAAGGVSLGVAVTLGLMARGDWADARAIGCLDSGACPSSEGRELGQSAASKANFATGFGIGGLVLVGAGVAIYLTAPSARAYEAPRIAPAISPTGAGVTIGGRF
jgi:hypothetical protein